MLDVILEGKVGKVRPVQAHLGGWEGGGGVAVQ